MPRLLPALALVAVIPLIAGCGSAGSGGSTPAREASIAQVQAPAASLVLHLPDLESGFAAVPKYTKPISLRDELKSDAPGTRAADRAGFRDGYAAFYANGTSDAVLSDVLLYRDVASATTVFHDTTGLAKLQAELHGRLAPAPAGTPGSDPIFITGRISLRGAYAPAYVLAWRHDTVINVLACWGLGTSTSHLLSLAHRQDAHITAAA